MYSTSLVLRSFQRTDLFHCKSSLLVNGSGRVELRTYETKGHTLCCLTQEVSCCKLTDELHCSLTVWTLRVSGILLPARVATKLRAPLPTNKRRERCLVVTSQHQATS